MVSVALKAPAPPPLPHHPATPGEEREQIEMCAYIYIYIYIYMQYIYIYIYRVGAFSRGQLWGRAIINGAMPIFVSVALMTTSLLNFWGWGRGFFFLSFFCYHVL